MFYHHGRCGAARVYPESFKARRSSRSPVSPSLCSELGGSDCEQGAGRGVEPRLKTQCRPSPNVPKSGAARAVAHSETKSIMQLHLQNRAGPNRVNEPRVPASEGAGASAKPRLREVDFWRGVSLLAIYLIHVPFGPWVYLQWAPFGFSDPAAVFFFLSGFVGYEAVERTILSHGWRGTWGRSLRRTAELYKAHLVLATAVVVVSVIGIKVLGLNGIFGPAMQQVELDAAQHPVRFWIESTFFYSQHFCTDILPTFIVLGAVAPLANLLARKNPWLLGLAILGLWVVARLFPTLNFPAQSHPEGWLFNPLRWQLLYFGGSFIASLRARGVTWPRLHPITWAAVLGYLLSAVLVKQPGILPQPYSYYFSLMQPTEDLKMTLAPDYIVHFFALVLVVHTATRGAQIVAWFPGANWLEAVGRNSLWAFVASTLGVYVVSLVIGYFELGQTFLASAVVLLGALTLPGVAWWVNRGAAATARPSAQVA